MIRTVLLLFLIPATAFSAGGGHGEGHIPLSLIISQLVNTGLLVGIIYYFAGKQIAAFFSNKKKEYLSFVESASKSVGDAEKRNADLKDKLKSLRANIDSDLEQAANSADENYRTQIADTRNDAAKIAIDSENIVEAELLKAVEGLRVETFSKSAKDAEKNMESNLTDQQQRAWNQSFPERLKGVH